MEFLSLLGANIPFTLLALAIASIPLYFSVKLMGGDVGFFEAMLVTLIAAGIPIIVGLFFNSSIQLLSLLAIIVAYMLFFRLSFGKAVLAWIIQYAIVFGILWLLGSVHLGGLGI